MNKIFNEMDNTIDDFFKSIPSCVEQSPCTPCFTGSGECDDGELLKHCMTTIQKSSGHILSPESLLELNKAFRELSKNKGIDFVGLCKGENCTSVNEFGHSDECIKEHDACVVGHKTEYLKGLLLAKSFPEIVGKLVNDIYNNESVEKILVGTDDKPKGVDIKLNLSTLSMIINNSLLGQIKNSKEAIEKALLLHKKE